MAETSALDTVLSDNLANQLRTSRARYRFPINHEEEYLGSINFTAVEEDFLTLQDIEAGSQFLASLVNSDNTQQTADDIALHNGTNTEQQTIKPKKFNGEIRGGVSLYLPASLQFTDGIEYNNVSLGATGALGEAALANNGGNILNAATAMFNDLPLLDILKTGAQGPAGQLALQRVLAKTPIVGGEGVTNVASLASGLVLNPNTRSLLRGVSLRRFRFQFNLIPTSQRESNEIKNIIKFFRTSMYPEDVSASGVTVGYKFPYKFIIKMRYKGNKVATGILPCFLENFDTNYNPNAMGMMSDGNFPEVNISMSFLESRTLRKSDIEGGY